MNDPQMLISNYLLGTIDDTDQAELAAWIKSDQKHADLFIRHAFVHSRLGSTLRGQSVIQQLQLSLPRTVEPAHGSLRIGARHHRLRWVGVAASVLIIASAISLMTRQHLERNRLATVQASLHPQWEGTPLSAGENVEAGTYHLQSGLVRIDFSHGSQVIVQGPALFSVSTEHLRLDSGQITVACPNKSSRSLVVETSDASIVDLGTEYGVSASTQSGSQVEVFQGSVQVAAKKSSPLKLQILDAGQHWQAALSTSSATSTFVREGLFELLCRTEDVSPAAKSAAELHDLLADPSLLFCCDFNPLWDGNSTVNLARRDDPWLGALQPAIHNDFVPGRVDGDKAMAFSKLGQALRVNIPGRFHSLTLAAWIKLDSEPLGSQRHRGLLMPDGWGAIGEVHWQIKKRGIRVTIFDRGDDEDPRYSADDESLFDGNWHQCVSVINGDAGLGANTVSHYVDGKLIYTREIRRPIPTLSLGNCCIGNWVPSPEDLADDRTLGGAVDEMMIWNRPLNTTEVSALFSQPPR